VDRCLLALVNEGAKAIAEGIAFRPVDIDIVYVNGYGFPAERGGPMFQADARGVTSVVQAMRRFAATVTIITVANGDVRSGMTRRRFPALGGQVFVHQICTTILPMALRAARRAMASGARSRGTCSEMRGLIRPSCNQCNRRATDARLLAGSRNACAP